MGEKIKNQWLLYLLVPAVAAFIIDRSLKEIRNEKINELQTRFSHIDMDDNVKKIEKIYTSVGAFYEVTPNRGPKYVTPVGGWGRFKGDRSDLEVITDKPSSYIKKEEFIDFLKEKIKKVTYSNGDVKYITDQKEKVIDVLGQKAKRTISSDGIIEIYLHGKCIYWKQL